MIWCNARQKHKTKATIEYQQRARENQQQEKNTVGALWMFMVSIPESIAREDGNLTGVFFFYLLRLFDFDERK